ncbi:hypothetical protein [Streptomyces sviceus]|uniref:hypothetical protein n=1 Tax=Streptomyces sviceus TaxID=285530 RepID=UPI00332853FF
MEENQETEDGSPADEHTEPKRARPDVHYPLVLNGLDYLISVVDHLADGPDPRDLKYAVLHLQAATEVLLKARLELEHFSLVFKDPARANLEDFRKGSFESCGMQDVIVRLRNIAQVAIDDKDARAIKSLAEARNALQHYGLIAPAYRVEAQAVHVLAFLLSFVRQHLFDTDYDLASENDKVLGVIEKVEEKALKIKILLDRRSKRARSEIGNQLDRTVRCPFCREWTALVDGNGEEYNSVICRCCEQSFGAELYLQDRWDRWEYELDSPDADLPPPRLCPICDEYQLVLRARTAKSPDDEIDLCFYCATIFDDLSKCAVEKCQEVFVPDGSDRRTCRRHHLRNN